MNNAYKFIKYILIILTILILSLQILSASEVKVSNISISEINKEKKYAYIKFDIEWKNSWRCDLTGSESYEEPANRDAVWIFIKYLNDNNWYHAELSHINHQHIVPGIAEAEASIDGRGIFLFRKNNGKGDFCCKNVKLKWNYAFNNIQINDSIPLKVFAVEMVYIPEGSFYAGDNKSTGSFYDKSTKKPVLISNNSVVVKTGLNYFDDKEIRDKGIVINGKDGISSESGGFYNAEFPTGYKAFYIMKYEISQQQYTDFLNTLSETQADNRAPNKFNKYNNFIQKINNIYECSNGKMACNYLSWMDGAAFADWAGLRPMTELEFEKACRGFNTIKSIPNPPIQGEYAWNNAIISKANIKSVTGLSKMQIEGNACFEYSTINGERLLGPFATGIFENKNIKTKFEMGASYYGVMELSGNLTELVVTIGNAAGRSFSGHNGDGCLTNPGDADVTNWPGINDNKDDSYPNVEYLGNAINSPGVTASAGAGQRGGNWSQPKELLSISDRTFASRKPKGRDSEYGFRCVRSARGNDFWFKKFN